VLLIVTLACVTRCITALMRSKIAWYFAGTNVYCFVI
jgi:hypothetical protein